MVGYAAVIIREHRAQRVDKLALHQRVPHKSTACQMVYLCARVDEGRVVRLLGVCGKKVLGQVFLKPDISVYPVSGPSSGVPYSLILLSPTLDNVYIARKVI